MEGSMIECPAKIPEEYKDFLGPIFELGGFVAGSFAATCSGPNLGFKPNDIDIWTETRDNFSLVFNKLKSSSYVSYKGASSFSYNKVHNFITSFPIKLQKSLQLIENINPIEEIINKFDFSICKAYLKNLDSLIVNDLFFQDVADKRLRYSIGAAKNKPCGLISYRLAKYINRFYLPEIEDIIHILSDLKKEEIEVFLSGIKNLKPYLSDSFISKINVLLGMQKFGRKV